MSTKRVLAAVSGGVDSSVAVHLLRQQGYEVEGVILEFSPAHRAAVESARVIAEQMKMPLHVIECHREFEENVILPFCREYREGRTPNPCILCNPSTKFALICKAAAELGFDFVATGHYARVEHQPDGTAVLRKSDCLERDQSYMLYRLTQQQLSMLLLPLEGLEKTQVRQIAHQLGLACADAPDSQEICWLPDGDYASFIEQKLGSCPAGEFISPDGTVCGQHKGLLLPWGIRSLSAPSTRRATASILPAPVRSTHRGCCCAIASSSQTRCLPCISLHAHRSRCAPARPMRLPPSPCCRMVAPMSCLTHRSALRLPGSRASSTTATSFWVEVLSKSSFFLKPKVNRTAKLLSCFFIVTKP